MKERPNYEETRPLKVLTCTTHGIVFFNGTDGQPVMAMGRNSLEYAKARHTVDTGCEGPFSVIKVPKFVVK